MNKFLKITAAFGCLLVAGSQLYAFCPGYDPYVYGIGDKNGLFKREGRLAIYGRKDANDAKFASTNLTTLADSEEVIGFESGERTWCFPLRLMSVHRIAAFDVGGEKMTVTYCPLSYSAVMYRPEYIAGSGIRKGSTELNYDGEYAGSMVFAVITQAGTRYSRTHSLHSQLNPSMRNSANTDGRSLKLGPPVVLTTYVAWRQRHPSTAVMQPYGAKFESEYAEFDHGPKGFTPSDLRDETMRTKDRRLSPGANVFGVAIEQDAVAFTLDEIERLGSITTLVGTESITIRWDKQLATPIVVDPPEGIVATRVNWYSWSSVHPRVPLNETHSRAAVTDWAHY